MARVYGDVHYAKHTGSGVLAGAADSLARIVYGLAGILMTLLSLRFVLTLLGAHPANQIANFIYTTSHPFVAPFFGLFNYQSVMGVSRFEIETLVAIIVYAIASWVIVRMLGALIGRRDNEA